MPWRPPAWQLWSHVCLDIVGALVCWKNMQLSGLVLSCHTLYLSICFSVITTIWIAGIRVAAASWCPDQDQFFETPNWKNEDTSDPPSDRVWPRKQILDLHDVHLSRLCLDPGGQEFMIMNVMTSSKGCVQVIICWLIVSALGYAHDCPVLKVNMHS